MPAMSAPAAGSTDKLFKRLTPDNAHQGRLACASTSSLLELGGAGRKLWRAPATPRCRLLVSTRRRSGNSLASSLRTACSGGEPNQAYKMHHACRAMVLRQPPPRPLSPPEDPL